MRLLTLDVRRAPAQGPRAHPSCGHDGLVTGKPAWNTTTPQVAPSREVQATAAEMAELSGRHPVIDRRTFLAGTGAALLAAPLAVQAQQAGTVLPWDPAPRKVILELQQALAHAIERFQSMDEAGVLSHVSDNYRTDPLTKAAIREQLRVMFALYDAFRAQVSIDEARTAGEHAWVYSTGDVSGRLRWLGTWMPVLSWKHEPEVARREQGVWRLYGYQR